MCGALERAIQAFLDDWSEPTGDIGTRRGQRQGQPLRGRPSGRRRMHPRPTAMSMPNNIV